MYYVASPYSGYSSKQAYNTIAVQAACAELFRFGINAVSPIAHWAPIANQYALPHDAKTWQLYNDNLMDICDGIILVALPGWEKSEGVQYELAWAKEKGRPVYTLDLPDFTQGEYLERACHSIFKQITRDRAGRAGLEPLRQTAK